MPPQSSATANVVPGPASAWSIFWIFLKLGLTSFGGPVAHLAYFRHEFVERRCWIDDDRYGDLVALCQFLPGPTSSQVGFALGILRGHGLPGGCAAWLGFTIPSTLLMFACALGAATLSGPRASGALHGLKLVAAAVVAQALWGMARSLTPDRQRMALALAACLIVTVWEGPGGQLAAIVLCAVAGFRLRLADDRQVYAPLAFAPRRRSAVRALLLFAVLLFGLPALSAIAASEPLALFEAFFRSGALVFGGGHVVLPLLQAETVDAGWISGEVFLAGYGIAQALPGPLFAFAAFLGAQTGMANAPIAAAIALVALFLPGLLLVYGTLPFQDRLRHHAATRRAMMGANAAVVGILAAALVDPVWSSTVHGLRDAGLVLGAFILLTLVRVPPWIVVILAALAGLLLARA